MFVFKPMEHACTSPWKYYKRLPLSHAYAQGLRSVAEPGTDLHKVQVWFTDTKLRAEDGDMYDIYKSYMSSDVQHQQDSCRHFFVAESRGDIVGCVGVKESTACVCHIVDVTLSPASSSSWYC
jgi:hypothetical protein